METSYISGNALSKADCVPAERLRPTVFLSGAVYMVKRPIVFLNAYG
jgi:hypothetical protein